MSALDPQNATLIPGLGAPARQAQADAAAQRAQQATVEARQNEEAKASAAHTAHIAQQDKYQQLGHQAANDAVDWARSPEYAGKSWSEASAEAPQHFVDAWGDIKGELPSIWNQAQRDVTGIPGIGVNLEPGQYAQSKVGGSNVTVGKPVPDQGARLLRTQAAREGITDLPSDATNEEIQDRIATEQQRRQQQKESKDVFSEDAKKAMIIDRTKRMVQNNPQVRYYQGALANFDSIQKNVSKQGRTGADDAFLAQAAATMEAPGRSPTAHDVAVLLKARGIQGNIEVLEGRVQSMLDPANRNKGGRLFDDRTAADIAAAAKNALDTRRESLVDAMTPHVNRFEDLGEDPYRHLPKSLVDEVYGVKPTMPNAQSAPEQRQTERTATNPKTGEKVVLRNGQWVPLK